MNLSQLYQTRRELEKYNTNSWLCRSSRRENSGQQAALLALLPSGQVTSGEADGAAVTTETREYNAKSAVETISTVVGVDEVIKVSLRRSAGEIETQTIVLIYPKQGDFFAYNVYICSVACKLFSSYSVSTRSLNPITCFGNQKDDRLVNLNDGHESVN